MKLSNTTQRKIIIEELKKLKTHPTADELFGIVRKRLPNISLATVYRNLDKLADAGKILRLKASGTQKRFDGNIKPHHHMRCVSCSSVSDLKIKLNKKLSATLQEVVEANKLIGCNVEFEGKCSMCD